MAQYQQVHVKFWRDPEVRRWSDQGKLLAQYLLTSAHRATEGLFYLPRAYVAADLDWSTDEVVYTFDEIESFALYDSEVDVVWIVNALKYQPPTGSRQVGGAITRLQQLPDTQLWGRFCAAVKGHAPDLWEKMEEEGMTADTVYDPENEPAIPYTGTSEGDRKGSSDSSSTSNSSSNSTSTSPPTPQAAGEDRQTKSEVGTAVDAIRHGLPDDATTDRKQLEKSVRPLIERGWPPERLAHRLLNMKPLDGIHSYDAVLRQRCQDLAEERSPAEVRADANRDYDRTRQMLQKWKADEDKAWNQEVGA